MKNGIKLLLNQSELVGPFSIIALETLGFPGDARGKEFACNAIKPWLRSLSWEDPLEKGKLLTPIFWPGEFHGLYSPWGGKQSDTTERLSLQ